MDEYISREAVIDMLHRHSMMSNSISEIARIAGIKRAVREIPTADVVEVRHGEWIYHECVSSYDGTVSGYSCSECCAFVREETFEEFEDFYNKHCGHCGAKMDKK